MANVDSAPASTLIGVLTLSCLTWSQDGLAQEADWEVSTFSFARANGDIFVADNGDVYINDFGRPSLGNGSTLVKVKPDGSAWFFLLA